MNTSHHHKRLISAVLALWLAMMACSGLRTTSVGSLKTGTQSVDIGAASSASVKIDMAAGELNMEGGAEQLMQASFRTNVEELQPRINYNVSGSQGELVIDHRDSNLPVGGKLVNEWVIRMNDNVPLDVEVHTGASVSDLDFSTLNLASILVDVGAGATHIDLSGNWDHDVSASITGGVGEMSVRLPADMGVRVTMDRALVSVTTSGLVREGDGYVNQNLGSSAHTLTLNIQAGVGSIELVAP